MQWNDVLSNSFHISNGVCLGGVLSPYLFSLYMNTLSKNLNHLRVDCYIGSNKLNYVYFADDICLLAPSLNGLQDLVYFSNPNSFVFQLLLPFFLVQTLCLLF